MTNAEGHQQQLEQRQQEEDDALERSLRISGYACAMIKRDKLTPAYSRHSDTSVDGRPLWIGNTPYDEYCAPKGADKI